MIPKENSRPAWRIWIIAGSLAFALILGLAQSILSLRDRKWAALEARVEVLRAELEPSALERLPLGRTVTEGNAWDDYFPANPYLPGKTPRVIAGKIIPWLQGDPKANREEVESLVSEFSSEIELVRSGVRRQTAKPPREPEYRGFSDPAYLCIGKARLLADAGKTSEALDLLMDVCLFGRDIAEGQPGYVASGNYVLKAAVREMREVVQKRPVEPQDLRRLEAALKLLDDHFPRPSRDVHSDLLSLGKLLILEDREDREAWSFSGKDRHRRSWRYCYSTRLQALATFERAEDVVNRACALEAQSWAIAGPVSKALVKEVRESEDILLANSLNKLSGIQWATATRGSLRVLRVAVHYRAEGGILELDDPVGGKIGHQVTDQRAMFWQKSLFGSPAGWQPKPGKWGYDSETVIEIPLPR